MRHLRCSDERDERAPPSQCGQRIFSIVGMARLGEKCRTGELGDWRRHFRRNPCSRTESEGSVPEVKVALNEISPAKIDLWFPVLPHHFADN
jgi:hypothetical protein